MTTPAARRNRTVTVVIYPEELMLDLGYGGSPGVYGAALEATIRRLTDGEAYGAAPVAVPTAVRVELRPGRRPHHERAGDNPCPLAADLLDYAVLLTPPPDSNERRRRDTRQR
jgi:hypothetical protein